MLVQWSQVTAAHCSSLQNFLTAIHHQLSLRINAHGLDSLKRKKTPQAAFIKHKKRQSWLNINTDNIHLVGGRQRSRGRRLLQLAHNRWLHPTDENLITHNHWHSFVHRYKQIREIWPIIVIDLPLKLSSNLTIGVGGFRSWVLFYLS